VYDGQACVRPAFCLLYPCSLTSIGSHNRYILVLILLFFLLPVFFVQCSYYICRPAPYHFSCSCLGSNSRPKRESRHCFICAHWCFHHCWISGDAWLAWYPLCGCPGLSRSGSLAVWNPISHTRLVANFNRSLVGTMRSGAQYSHEHRL